jgi:hypothetical protein
MSVVSRTRWLRRFGTAAVVAVGLCAVALPVTSTPAHAGINVTLGVPGGWGYYAPPPAPYYYPYGYPAYGYPARVYYHHPYYHRHWHHPYHYGYR